ncbi:MAG: Uma2 family endonuclease [Chloroflexi bacterium]|nr:Uma2 family endonuclease [Chloroflexota bacterium]MYE42071.1 Uma2 family endonuclease [Chloroflexota bacterium]
MATLKPRTGIQLSVEEFMELPDTYDKRKMELDEGDLYIMPRPRMGHQFLQIRVVGYVDRYLDEFDDPPAEVFHDVIVALSLEDRILFAPDMVIILRGGRATVTDRMVEGPPDIVLEILSSDRRRDLVRKRQVYAEAGVLEYWIFDPRQDTPTLLELRDGQYDERAVLIADDTLTTPLLPCLAIPLADVFRHRRRPAQ